MRTSEIIMLIPPFRSASSAFSPDETGTVSNPWLRRNESSKLRWPASSSTIKMRGAFTSLSPAVRIKSFAPSGNPAAAASGGKRETGSEPVHGRILHESARGRVQVGDSENRASRVIGHTFYLPTVRQNDLLDHGQAQPRSFLVRGEIGFENFGAVLRRNAGAVVADLEDDPVRILFPGRDLDVSTPLDGLNGVDREIK